MRERLPRKDTSLLTASRSLRTVTCIAICLLFTRQVSGTLVEQVSNLLHDPQLPTTHIETPNPNSASSDDHYILLTTRHVSVRSDIPNPALRQTKGHILVWCMASPHFDFGQHEPTLHFLDGTSPVVARILAMNPDYKNYIPSMRSCFTNEVTP